MSLTKPIRLFGHRKPLPAHDQALAAELSAGIEALMRQLDSLRIDANRSAADLRGTSTKQLLQHAKVRLDTINREIKLRATPPAQVVVDGVIRANQAKALPLTVSFLQEKAQQVVEVYNHLITHDTFKQKSSTNVLTAVTELFANFFTKIADYFRKHEGAVCQGSWKQSPAQKNIAGQFDPVIANFEAACKRTQSATPEAPSKVQTCVM